MFYFFVAFHLFRDESVGRFGLGAAVDQCWLVVLQSRDLVLVQLVVVEPVATRAKLGQFG